MLREGWTESSDCLCQTVFSGKADLKNRTLMGKNGRTGETGMGKKAVDDIPREKAVTQCFSGQWSTGSNSKSALNLGEYTYTVL